MNFGIKTKIRTLETTFWDTLLNISTLGVMAGGMPESKGGGDCFWYQSKCFYLNHAILKPLRLGTRDVFFDVGCGAGRVICIAALSQLRGVVGVELSSRLCAIARVNALNLRFRRSPIEVLEADATTVDYSKGTAFFFCNPFGAQTMEAVLNKIRESLASNPRQIKLVYVHPHPEHHALFKSQSWLIPTDEKRFLGEGAATVTYFKTS